MKQIRRSIFETNSSSCHSITIATKGELLQTMVGGEDGMIHICGQDYGWEVETYSMPIDKASYCYTYAMNSFGSGENENPDGRLLQMLRDVIESQTHYKVSFDAKPNDYHQYGYIDHQSSDVAAEAFVNPTALRQFLFCPESILHTDNDNH